MTPHAAPSCQTCGNALPPGALACTHAGCPASGEPSAHTQTLPPPALLPREDVRADGAELEPFAPEPPAPDALVGQQLGEYVVRRYVGCGGMGVVYEGEHTTIGRKVAIKFIREELTHGPHARGLLSEARAASSIRHHGIIDIFGFGQQPGVGQYLVMEYLEGRPLDEVVKERGALPLQEALPLLCEVLDALSAAHASGVIHRDLKPSNIFVVRQSDGTTHVKVLDFGLAKRTDTPDGTTAQTHSNLIVGTPQYMAPEQALGAQVGPRTDLYAVGVIAFELLTGRRPFPGRSQMEVVVHHLQTPPPVPSSLVALPAELDALILRLLAKEPSQRPASASEVARELRALLRPREGASLSPARLSRVVPVVTPTSDAAGARTPTATLSPAPATPPPAEEVTARPPPRAARRKWSAVAGGCLVLALGAGLVLNRGSGTEQAPAVAPPPLEAAPAVAQQTPPPQTPSPQTAPEPTPAPVAVTRPLEPASAPAKKKKPQATQPAPATPVAAASLQPPAAAPEPVPERAATGMLHLQVKGAWTDVWVDGQRLGRVPPQNKYPLAAGEHALELRNPALAPYRRQIVIPPNGTLTHTADFTPESQAAAATP